MSLQPLKDNGQELPPLGGLLICVLDDREQVDRAAGELNKAGYPNDKLILLHGEDGFNLVHRAEAAVDYFSDAPQQLFCRDKSVLSEGRYALAVPVGNGKKAREVAALIRPHGAHGFMHFGMFVDTKFN